VQPHGLVEEVGTPLFQKLVDQPAQGLQKRLIHKLDWKQVTSSHAGAWQAWLNIGDGQPITPLEEGRR
jgi:hypothetical protein